MDHDPVKLTICGAERFYLGDSAKLNDLEAALAEAFRLGLRRCCSRGPYWRIQTPGVQGSPCGYFYCPHCQQANDGCQLESAIYEWNRLLPGGVGNNFVTVYEALMKSQEDLYETEVYD